MNNIIGGFLMPHAPILIEEIGKGEEKKSQKTVDSMNKIAENIKRQKPETILIITPHGNFFRNAISINLNENLYGNFHQFGNEKLEISVNNDVKLANKIASLAEEKDIETYTFSKEAVDRYNINHELDHGVLVPLYFIRKKYSDFKLVHINYAFFSGEKLYEFGKLIQKASELLGREIVVIASGDLSHRLTRKSYSGYSPKGEKFDRSLIRLLKENKLQEIVNFDKNLAEEAGECGLRSIQTALGVFDDLEIETKVYSYEGPFGVGYGCVKIEVVDEHVKLAKLSIKTFLDTGEKLKLPENLNKEDFYNKIAGTFVSLKKDGELRGCIGTIFPTKESLGKEIIENAVSAAFRDPRFYPVKKEELDELDYSVDVLEEPEEIKDISKLNPKIYGVIVTKGSRKGVLLPNLEGVETVEKQLDIVLRKAGINKEEDYTLERFKVIRHK
ncbi:MAG: AmmeMemoRadiSam system protein A [Bacillota bacterium]|nr:AmmeMemoRadiSam system protein A [Bacillota bacterium]